MEVFDHLIANEETPGEIDYLTYAIFAYRRVNWSERYIERHGKQPGQTEIDEWIAGLSEYDFERMREEAIEFFDAAASRYMRDEILKARNEGAKESFAETAEQIKTQIQNLGRLRNQLVTALITAIITPIILGGSIFFIRTFEQYMPSATHIFSDEHPTSLTASPPPTPAPPDTPTKK
jgi:hypothetical protein